MAATVIGAPSQEQESLVALLVGLPRPSTPCQKRKCPAVQVIACCFRSRVNHRRPRMQYVVFGSKIEISAVSRKN
jgi:hypothetical protein